MPGPVSDCYDPEWGSSTNASAISGELRTMYKKVSQILDNKPPLNILDIVFDNVDDATSEEMDRKIVATLPEREWRILRFALERAEESL